MQYISTDEFLKQPEKVQKVFLDWWQPEMFDVVTFKYGTPLEKFSIIDFGTGENEGLYYCCGFCEVEGVKEDFIPLLTEGQLRQFIEDKTKTILLTEFVFDTKNYSIIGFKNCNEYKFLFDILGEDLLHAYWKVACIVAEKE